MGLCGSGSYHCSLLEVPIFVCGVFSVAAELCILSSCWGWGRLLLSLFLVCLLSNLPGAPAVFCFVSASWRPFWGSTPRCLRLADLLLRWGFLATDILLPHFGFLPCASAAPLTLLPLWGSAPLPGASACLTPVCWSIPGVVLEGCVLCHLVFLPCAVLFLRACSVRCFP